MKVLIIGGGQVGTYLANLLISNNCIVRIIENRETSLEKLKKFFSPENIIEGNGTDPSVLEAAGILDADSVAAVTGADETNLVVSTIAKFEFNIPRVVARVNNPQNAWLFNSGMGVDAALNQADLMAHLVVEEMDLKNIMTLMKLNKGDNSIFQIKANSSSVVIGKQVQNIRLPEKTLLISIFRGNESIIPNGKTVIQEGDEILVFADSDSQSKINSLFG